MSSPDKHSGNTRGPIAWMAGHGVAANLIMLACLVGGFLSLRNITQEVFPDVSLDTVTVSVAYPGASPEEVESSILLSIEEAVRNLEGVDEVISEAREGMGTVTIELLLGANVFRLAQEITSEVDRIITFPEEAEEPETRITQWRREVLSIVLYGDVPNTSLHALAERLREFVVQSPDVTQADIEGLPPLEISIEPHQDELRRYGLTLGMLAQKLTESAADIPAGGMKTEGGEILVRLKERRDYGKQFAELPIINTESGSKVLLRDIADIDDSFADTDRFSRYNGKNAVMIEVYRIGKETPMQVSDGALARLEEFQAYLPPGVMTDVYDDRSETYRQRFGMLLKNGAIGLVLVLGLLGLFLEARLAFWVMMGVPISFMGSFLFLPFFDVTINMMSLFAYIIALGIVVDDAIVVGENIYSYHQQGMKFLDAAIAGAREVAVSVVFSILTNIAAFIPIYFIPGTTGKIFQMIPVVVCVTFTISLIECMFVLPAHLGHHHDRQLKGLLKVLHGWQQAFSRGFTWWVHHQYGPVVKMAVRYRYVTMAFSLALLLTTLAYALSGRMGFQLFPVMESDYADAQIALPYGAPVSRTEALVKIIEDAARKVAEDAGHPELVTAVVTDIGLGGGHVGRVRTQLVEPDIRKNIMSTSEFTQLWRAEVGELSGIDTMRFAADSGGPGGRGRPVTVEITHLDMDILEKVSAELAQDIASFAGVEDVDDGFEPGKNQIDFTLKAEGKSLGLTAREVARQVRHALYGAEVLRQQRGRNEIKVMVRLPKKDRASEQMIEDLMLRTPSGVFVPFREIANFDRGRAYTTINRRNGRRVVQVSADVVPRSRAGEVLSAIEQTILPRYTRDYPGLSYSFEGHQSDIRKSFGSLRITFTMALLAIYAMLAIPFRSYLQPFIVMLSIPFGIVGAFWGHLLMGYDLCIPSIFGIVALSGVVVNDSLVMINFANANQREQGMDPFMAIYSSAVQRFRPMLLTTLTTFGGLAPMIFETSRQARFLIPMALSLGYGILFATFIVLFIVPSMYVIINDFKRLLQWLTRRGGAHVSN